MAEETSIKLLIEAEDRSREAYDSAQKRVADLKKAYEELAKKVEAAQTIQADGTYKLVTSGKEFFKLLKDQGDTHDKLQKAYGSQAATLHQLVDAHKAVTRATKDHGEAAKHSYGVAGDAIAHYVKHATSLAAVEEIVRHSFMAYAEHERGMARIELQSGKTGKQLEHLEHSFTEIARTTGQSIEQIQKSFLAFSAEMASSGPEVQEMFNQIQKAAFASGVTFEQMGQTSVEAMKTMQVPFGEIKGMLDVIVDKIPASAMGAWDNVAPKILSIMRTLGASGKEAVGQAATGFAIFANALGSAERGGQVYLQTMQKATNLSDTFGRMMAPQMIEIERTTGSATEKLEAMWQTLDKFGFFTADPLGKLQMQQQFGFSDEMLRGIEKGHKSWGEITAEVKKTGEGLRTVEERHNRLLQGPMAAVDNLKGAWDEFLVGLGKTIDTIGGSTALRAFTFLMDFFTKVREFGDKTPAEGMKAYGDAVQGFIDKLNKYYGFDLTDKRTGAPGRTPWLPDSAPKGMPFGKGGNKPGGGAALRGMLGFATGGSFEVGGQGGVDTEPVGFMASPGERVAVTTPTQESLQVQQDKADIAMREHFARFRDNTSTRGAQAPWWPGSSVRDPGAGGPLSGGGGGGGGIPGGSGGAYGAPGGGGGGGGGGADPPGTGTTPLKTPVGTDEKSETGPAEDIETAVKRGYLTQTGGGNSSLAAQRVRFAEEIKNNPQLREKILAISAGENLDNNANRAVFESAMNRASMMNTSLAYEMRRTNEGGYYAGYKPNMSAADRKIAEANLAAALGGSNVSNYATENASGSWGEKRMSGGMFTKVYQSGAKGNVELFGIPTGPGARGYDRYAAWKAKSQAGTTDTTAGGATVGTASSVLAGVRQGQTLNPDGTITAAGPEPNAVYPGDNQGSGRGSGGRFNVAAGAGMSGEKETVLLSNGQKVTVNKAAAPQFKGFFNDLIAAGAPVKNLGGYGLRGGNQSQHPPGMAVDWAQHSRNKVDPDVQKWLNEHKPILATLEKRWGMSGGQNWNNPDTGHWSIDNLYGAAHIAAAQAASAGGGETKVAGPAMSPAAQTQAQKDLEERARARYAQAVERNKPAAAQTNTGATTSQPAAGQRTPSQEGHEDTASGKPGSRPSPTPVRRMPSPPGQEDRASGKPGGAAPAPAPAATVPHPVSPQADPIPARAWGGSVRGGQAYTVGESGPETFTPSGSGQITPGGMDTSSMMAQYQQFAEMLRTPITPNIQMPNAGPIRQRMSRHVEQQRERDVGRMTRHASHSDIGFA